MRPVCRATWRAATPFTLSRGKSAVKCIWMQFSALVASVRKRGVLSPALRYRAEVLDGVQLMRACSLLDVECPVLETDDHQEAAQLLYLRHPRRALARFCAGLSVPAAAAYVDASTDDVAKLSRGWQRPRVEHFEGASLRTLWLCPITDGFLRTVCAELGMSRSEFMRVASWLVANAVGSAEARALWARRSPVEAHSIGLVPDTSASGLEWVGESRSAQALALRVVG